MSSPRKDSGTKLWASGFWFILFLQVGIASLAAQTPDAYLRGIVTDSEGRPVPGAEITAVQSETGLAQTTKADSEGEYFFGSLPRGLYSLRLSMTGYQGLEKKGIELAVGARHEENFSLSTIPTPAGQTEVNKLFQVVPPTASLPTETIASSVSVVVEENRILQLPLASRNIYSLFLLQPGVTSQEAISTRGLSFSLHGQRVSGSNYQLDGVDNNNIILTGPVAATSAETIQEFRMVNSSFSSEYGRATAFIAQVVTRSGTNRFHGSLFEFLANDKLNANTFENNAEDVAKPAFRQNQFGYSIGGPIARNKTFFSSGLEMSRLRYHTTRDLLLPSSSFIASLPPDSLARSLLTENPPLPTPTVDSDIGSTRYQVPGLIDTTLATERLDHHFSNAKDRLLARYALALTTEESSDGFDGYPSLRPTDRFRAHNALLGWTHSFDASKVNDLRVGWSRERIELPRPRPDIPRLQSFDNVLLPGNYRQSAESENNNVIQFSDTFSLQRGRSALTLGFEYRRNISNARTLGLQSEALGGPGVLPDGIYFFDDLHSFGQEQPFAFSLGVNRFAFGPLPLPDLARKYRSNEYAAFVQDDLKLSRRLSLNVGLRYEYFGVLHNTDPSQDVNFYFGSGSTIGEKLANGVLRSTDQNPGDLKGLLYRPDLLNFVPSIGVAWDPFGKGKTVVRAGYSMALDRVFDTVRDLRSNNVQVVSCFYDFGCPVTFAVPFDPLLPLLTQDLKLEQPGSVVQLDENLVTPYAQNWYFGIQQTVTPNFIVEIGHAGSVGRKLISRDLINRYVVGVPMANEKIFEDTYLSNAGNSNYLALELGLRRRFSHGLQYQISYTYSHAIDDQSDIFEGVRTRPAPALPVLSTFTLPLDSRVDRGNANFDQRHNLVFNAIWDLPRPHLRIGWAEWLLSGWTTSVIGAYRSGFPVTVIGTTEDFTSELRNNRVDFLGSPSESGNRSTPPPVPGGVQWLDPALFQPAVGHVGSLGRGALKGPGLWNYDFALIRTIGSSDRVRVQFRAEFYNLFNHANLSVPVSIYLNQVGSINEDFGQAFYGLNRTYSRFGDLPLEDPSRRIQFGLRIQF
jgi:hypothetical protein